MHVTNKAHLLGVGVGCMVVAAGPVVAPLVLANVDPGVVTSGPVVAAPVLPIVDPGVVVVITGS